MLSQTTNWNLRLITLLSRHIQETKALLADQDESLANQRERHYHQQRLVASDPSNYSQLNQLYVQQEAEVHYLVQYYAGRIQSLEQRHQQQEQALVHQLEQERIRQN